MHLRRRSSIQSGQIPLIMTSIRKALSSGIIYIAFARYSSVLISIIISAILSRLLTPEEFGTVALVSVFVIFFNLLSDFGLGPAVIQNQSLNEDDINSVFSFSLVLGFLLAGLFYFSAHTIGDFYQKEDLVNITKLLSLSVLFNSAQIVPRAFLQKELRFKHLGLITVGVQFLGGVTAIILAYSGFSYYSLVFQSILAGGISFLVFYALNPVKLIFNFRISAIKKIIRFSAFQFSFDFINYFSRNADNILVGKFFGSASLGFYDKSYRLMMMPVQNLTHVISPVLMPVLSKYQEDRNFVFQSYLKVTKLLAIFGFPLSVFLYFNAQEIVHIIFGPQWAQSVPVFKLLALTVGFQVVSSSSGSIFQVINRTDLLLYSGVMGAVIMLCGICYGVFIGKDLVSIGFGLIIAFILNFVQGFYFLINIAFKKSLCSFIKAFIYPLLMSFVIASVLWLFELNKSDNLGLNFALKLVIAGATYVFLVSIHKEYRIALKNILIR